jgi:hypothetical protein
VVGDSFWQAWDPKEAPSDPTLRLLLRLDGQPFAAYVDPQLDHDIPGAVVNTFAFDPAQMTYQTWDQAIASPPVITPGRALLRVDLSREKAGRHTLELCYQGNLGSKESADWHDLKSSSLDIELATNAPTTVRAEQARQQMSFGGGLHRPRMRRTETFRLQVFPDHAGQAVP